MSMISKYILGLILFVATALPLSAQTYELKVLGSKNGDLEVKAQCDGKECVQVITPAIKSVSLSIDARTTVSVKVIPKNGFKVNNWTGAGNVGTVESIRFSMDSNKTVGCDIVPTTN